MMAGSITIVGLGPGDGSLLTRRAWSALSTAETVYLRTARHPAVSALPAGISQVSFDPFYESAADFEQVYARIVAEIINQARQGAQVVYAVPGDPSVGESTVSGIKREAAADAIPLTIIPGVSFIEPVLGAVGVDGLAGLQLFDALELVAFHHPPLNPDVPVLVGQVYSRLLAGDLKLTLTATYPEAHPVLLVHQAGTPAEQVEEMPLYALDRSRDINHLTTLYIPPLPVSGDLHALAEVIAVLRSPEGCPWDIAQTAQSMRAGFLEEMAETLDALDADDPEALREELGDLLLHILFQIQLAREEETFLLADIIGDIVTKLIRRHPHVWGDWQVQDAGQVKLNWEQLKAQEEKQLSRHSLLDSVPLALPSLARAQKIGQRVRKVGFDWPDVAGVVAKVEEELAELRAEKEPAGRQREFGDLLFALVNWARWLDIDAEVALREANRRFTRRFQTMEQLAAGRGLNLADLDIDHLEALWQEVKARNESW
jgi:tetrapyrrole methylase family protein/MazG family protein